MPWQNKREPTKKKTITFTECENFSNTYPTKIVINMRGLKE